MRYLQSLLLFVALGFLASCSVAPPIDIPFVQIPRGMRMVNIFIEHTTLNVGDHVDVISADNGYETTVLTDVELATLTKVDAKRDAGSFIVYPEDAEKLAEASKQYKFRVRLSHTNCCRQALSLTT
jgi:hypothetical protein